MSAPPVLGAAVTLDALERLRNWLFERERAVEVQDFFDPELLEGDWRGAAERCRALLDGHRGAVGVHGPFWGFAIDTWDRAVAQVVERRMMQCLDVCETLGADLMVIHSPFTTWDHNNLDMYPGARDALTERVHRNMTAVVRRAEDQGVTLAIENIEDKDPHARVALARSFDSPAVRVSLDTGHAMYAHGATGAPPVDYYVRAAGPMLAHVHLQDADGYADRHWVPGEGAVRWPAVFRAIAELPEPPRLILEMGDNRRLVEAAAALEAMGLGV